MTGYLNSLASVSCLLPRPETCLERAGLWLALWGSERELHNGSLPSLQGRPPGMPGLMWSPNTPSGCWFWVGGGVWGGVGRGAGGGGSKK